jgi:hypothetical protein
VSSTASSLTKLKQCYVSSTLCSLANIKPILHSVALLLRVLHGVALLLRGFYTVYHCQSQAVLHDSLYRVATSATYILQPVTFTTRCSPTTPAPARELVASLVELARFTMFQRWNLKGESTTYQCWHRPSSIMKYSLLLIKQRHYRGRQDDTCQLWMRPNEKEEKRSST